MKINNKRLQRDTDQENICFKSQRKKWRKLEYILQRTEEYKKKENRGTESAKTPGKKKTKEGKQREKSHD